jgi:hypothetical protein
VLIYTFALSLSSPPSALHQRDLSLGAFKREGYNGHLKEGMYRLLLPVWFRRKLLISSPHEICRGKWLAPFLLAALAAVGLPSAGRTQPLAGPFPASHSVMAAASQAGTELEKGAAPTVPGKALIQAAVGNIDSPNLQALARALGMTPAQIGRQAFEDSDIGMEAVSGLGDGGAPNVAVKWRPAGQGQNPGEGGESKLYLLSWNGKGWHASYLMASADALILKVLPVQGDTAPLFAVVVYRGTTAVPFPVIFRFQDHQASLVWDGRSESSSYTGYDYGSIEFKKAGEGNVPVMIVAGQADPGLLMFPDSQQQTERGFQAATAYVWKNDAYTPIRTEYTHNRDYLLYSFIAALHLRDYKKAYSFIDPAQFLETKKPSLKLFRERIQNAWPEFVDDRIFEVPARPEVDPDRHAFILRFGGGKMNVYHPTFTPGPDYRLAGLARTESNY